MTQGALLVAFNNAHIDYVTIAAWNADRIRRFLNVPVTLITDSTDHAKLDRFDQVIFRPTPQAGQRWFEDIDATVDWRNFDRSHAALESPYDKTLVLDVDYIVNSHQLRCLLDSTEDFLCHRHAVNARSGELFNISFGKYNMPMYWATVMCFKRSKKADVIFHMMQMIQNNWAHYRDLYQIDRPAFRNDHALSIALNIESGQTLTTTNIPWNLVSVLPAEKLSAISDTEFRIEWNDGQKTRFTLLANQDFHAMGKSYLEKIIANQS